MDKNVFIKKYHRGYCIIIKGTIGKLTEYFGCTLNWGHSCNQKINTKPKTYKSLISNLNKSYCEIQGYCYNRNYVSEATEDDYINAESKGYKTWII